MMACEHDAWQREGNKLSILGLRVQMQVTGMHICKCPQCAVVSYVEFQ